jgi:hypothetical protein
MGLLLPSDQVCHMFRNIFASTKTTRSLRALQEAHSQVDFEAVDLEAFVVFGTGPFMSPAFSRYMTSNSALFMSFGFHMCVTVDSEWIQTPSFPGHVTNALALSKQKSLSQALGVDLQVRWRGETPIAGSSVV